MRPHRDRAGNRPPGDHHRPDRRLGALVAAWLPGSEGQGVADVLFGVEPFRGKLPYTLPRSIDQVPLGALAESGEEPLFPFGYGLEP